MVTYRLPTTTSRIPDQEPHLPLDPIIIDYYLSLLRGVPGAHARRRLTLLSAYDPSPMTLTRKILERPRLLERIRAAIADPACAHLSVFNATELEATLAVRLGIPLYACDPDLAHWGTKSGSRAVFRAAGVAYADGAEDLRDLEDVAQAIAMLKQRDPVLRRCVVKHNEGFSGEGNAVFDFDDAHGAVSVEWVRHELPRRLRCEAKGQHYEHYADKFRSMGGIVESWIDGPDAAPGRAARWSRTPHVCAEAVPGLSFDVDALAMIDGIRHYEERQGGQERNRSPPAPASAASTR